MDIKANKEEKEAFIKTWLNFILGLSLESVKMKVSYNYLVARAQGKTNKDAMNACAVKILKVRWNVLIKFFPMDE